ncbi:MAG: ComEC/Rec2 family competence protein [Isosphaeraceae bacterium]|nr:ComEC/Rec2 family competence protein [Isosphaeraceae bacterium]
MRTSLLRFGIALLIAAALLQVPPRPIAARGPAAATATIEFIDVGQGDAVLIRSPEGKTALIDAGPSSAVAESIAALGIRSLDLVAVSHHHTDHYGGMREVIKRFQPKYFLATNSKHTTSMYLKLLQLVESENIKAIQPLPNKPRRIELGSVVLTLFPQPPLDDKEENDNSIGIRVTYGDFSVILTGDSEEPEREWWKKNCPDLLRNANILKLAHHGSRNGTDTKWLDLIDPELAVASLGRGNSYGHPHSETITLLERRRIPLMRTDREGTIRITTDGRRWRRSREEVASRPRKISGSPRGPLIPAG